MSSHALDAARDVARREASAVAALADRLEGPFARAVDVILAATGRVVVTGLGKSGHVGGKIAATLASTGTPAFFVHATEALHGDAGMVTREDVVLAVSNSGETAEVCAFAEVLRDRGVQVLAMTGRADSRLSRLATAVLDISVTTEADPLNLAPTSSTTVTAAMGDCLAIALAVHRGFTPSDFARHHPAGSLGRRLAARQPGGA